MCVWEGGGGLTRVWWCPILSRGRGVNENVVVSYSLEGEGG